MFPTIRGQCLNTKNFHTVVNQLITEISLNSNPKQIITKFLTEYSDTLNSAQERRLVDMVSNN